MSEPWWSLMAAALLILFVGYADGSQGERRKDGAWVICEKAKPGSKVERAGLLEFCVVFTTETGFVAKSRKLVSSDISRGRK